MKFVQIAQDIKIAEIMKNLLLTCDLISRIAFVAMMLPWKDIPIELQHCLANGQLRNRCAEVSSVLKLHTTQLYDSSCMFFLLRISLVLSLSFRSNQKTTFKS
jgi:hypothetical protein